MVKKKKNYLKIITIKIITNWIKNHKILVISILALLLVFTLSGAKFLLYLKLLLGNDIILKIDVDKRNLYLMHNGEEKITFEAKVTTNPFCTALCKYSFKDISKDDIIEYDNFTLKPTTPFEKEYLISSSELGTGLALYRFDMECHSIRTALCHTKEEPSTRSILITVNYDLNEEEKKLKESLKEKIENLTKKLSFLKSQQNYFENISAMLNETLIFEDKTSDTLKYVNKLSNETLDLKGIWSKEDYSLLAKEIIKFEDNLKKAEKFFAEANNSLLSTVNSYNPLIDNIILEKNELKGLQELTVINTTITSEINKIIDEFNNISESLNKKSILSDKKTLQENINKKIISLKTLIDEYIRKEALRKELEININYDLLCKINNQCINHSSIPQLVAKPDFDLNIACNKIEEQRKLFAQINESIKDEFISQNYPTTDEFWQNIKLKLDNKKQRIISEYLQQLPRNSTNAAIIKELLITLPEKETLEYPEYNLTYAILTELTNQKPKSCNISNVSVNAITEIKINKIKVEEITPISLGISFEEPLPKCCVFGKCENCCLTQECKEDPSTFPVVFLHGHAIDKSTSAEYSLEGFNKLQKKLEEEGYLNAGTVTLYTLKDTPPGIWGMPKTALTVRASYYFDVFEEPENYIVIQTKSENIDTYSIRLKELIDIIKYKTGKPKVNIIAFSMGGLVTRRYIQLFGTESVNKVILIGTPNKGIVERTLDLCPIIGENLECRDMDSKSLFMNKLNKEPVAEIPFYNIVGSGCLMNGKIGDGVVLKEKALLDVAQNYIINGTCPSLGNPLHLNLRDIDLYPEVYSVIKKALKED